MNTILDITQQGLISILEELSTASNFIRAIKKCGKDGDIGKVDWRLLDSFYLNGKEYIFLPSLKVQLPAELKLLGITIVKEYYTHATVLPSAKGIMLSLPDNFYAMRVGSNKSGAYYFLLQEGHDEFIIIKKKGAKIEITEKGDLPREIIAEITHRILQVCIEKLITLHHKDYLLR